jgi:hypothetical protein
MPERPVTPVRLPDSPSQRRQIRCRLPVAMDASSDGQ